MSEMVTRPTAEKLTFSLQGRRFTITEDEAVDLARLFVLFLQKVHSDRQPIDEFSHGVVAKKREIES